MSLERVVGADLREEIEAASVWNCKGPLLGPKSCYGRVYVDGSANMKSQSSHSTRSDAEESLLVSCS